jgi:hypothetical protein
VSVLYRAMWSDASQGEPLAFVATVRQLFSSWAAEDPGASALPDGTTSVDLAGHRRREISIRTVESDADVPADVTDSVADTGERGETVRLVGIECITQDAKVDDDDSGTTFTTVVRVVSDETRVHVWVENRVETDDLSLRVKVGRPRLVDDLLSIPGKPRLGGSGLFVDVLPIPANGIDLLVENLRSPERTLPVIVCTEPEHDPDGRWRIWSERIARRAGGIASVVVLDAAGSAAFRSRLGPLAVWGGAVRVYTPAPLDDQSDGWRHRYTLGHLMASREDAMIDRIVFNVAQMSTRRRTDPVFSGFTSTAPAAGVTDGPLDLTGYVSEDEAEARRLEHEFAQDLAQEEQDALHRELNQALGHLDRMKRALEEKNLSGLFWEAQYEAGNDMPDEVQDTDDAILSAQMYLADWLVIHDDAPRDLDGINTGPQAVAWGNTTWRGFRALAGYAEARSAGFQGSFYDWCKSGPPLGWPATSKKLSMTESDTVKNGRSLAAARHLPVSKDVDSSGFVTMWSHLKIAEGGGDLAPRVYFCDDSDGRTGKVHVGFVGPHYLMPNTKS